MAPRRVITGLQRLFVERLLLKARQHVPTDLLNLKVPTALFNAIGALAKRLGAGKAEVVTALLNTGLDRWKARKR